MDPNQQILHDTLCTAIEGGIDYWAEINFTEKQMSEDPETKDDWYYISASIYETDGALEHLVTADTIKLGIDRIVSDANPVHSRYSEACREAMRDPENSGVWIDADVADIIVQVGLFGEARYG